jgi:type IV fimbrial biogenesis protein FimT
MLIRRANSAAGFTMIELMVTLGIFAILTAVAVPSMRTWVANNKVRAVADALQNGLRLAQAESMRRSRQVVFALTNSTTPNVKPVAAVPNGTSWAIWTVPSMTDSTETPEFVQSGVLSSASSTVNVDSSNPTSVAAVCFNSMGRLVPNGSANVILITGLATCVTPTGTPPAEKFTITATGADRPLQVTLGVGGTVHMCDPNVPISDSHPEGC